MGPVGKSKFAFARKYLSCIIVGFRAIISVLVSRLAGVVVIAIMVAAFLVVLPAAPVGAAPEEEAPLECLSCHTRVLKGHDKLGSGSEACWVCHDSVNIGKLRLFDGTQLPLANSSQLCGQCHGRHYQDWNEGTHGVLAGREGEPGVSRAEKLKCIDCHNPHEPQMALTAITEPHPLPAPPASGEEAPLECLNCHAKVLKSHDKLGEGSEACWACHYNMEMGVLHLAGGEARLPLSAYPQLCAQCHQKRYEDWAEGTHGMPSWKMGSVEIHGIEQVGCIGCHEPHQPQVTFLNITRPHPLPAAEPPFPSAGPLIMLGVSLLLVTGVGITLLLQREGP